MGVRPAPVIALTPVQKARFVLRAALLGTLIALGLAVMLILRAAERPFHGARRPWSARVQQRICRLFFPLARISHQVEGRPMEEPGIVVANHVSWVDIFSLNRAQRITFVAKAEVAAWPGIGPLARIADTLFVRRDRREARSQTAAFRDRLARGQRLLFFPEGTSTDGMRVLPFKSTLFAALFDPALDADLHVQPVTLIYTGPDGQDVDFYGWWGDTGFGEHLMTVLGQRRGGGVRVVYHPPFRVRDFADRKALTRACENTVRGAMPEVRRIGG